MVTSIHDAETFSVCKDRESIEATFYDETFIINLLFVSGTSDGYLKKAVIESATSGIEYVDIPISPGTSVRSDLLFDLKRDHIYVLTDKALSKVRVQDCQQYTDCNTCLGAKDPYCGWCSLENKCR